MATTTQNLTASVEQSADVEPTRKDVPRLWRFDVEEYDKMIEAGIFNENDRVELIQGRIIEMSPKNRPHAVATDRATRLFIMRLGNRAIVRNQNPIRLNGESEPEPDIILAAPHEKEYLDHHPMPKEILFILEVADTSLDFDRHEKGRIYAQAGIIQHALLNVRDKELEDYREPSADGYRSKRTYTAEQSFDLVAFHDVTIAVKDLLPPE